MPGRLEPDPYISVIATENFGVKFFEAFVIVGEGKRRMKNFAFSSLNKALVLVFSNVDANQNHKIQILFCPESSCEMNRPAVSDLLAVKQRAVVRISIKPSSGR